MPEIKSLYHIADGVNICSIIDQSIFSHKGVKARGVAFNIIYCPGIVETLLRDWRSRGSTKRDFP
jgi:hypothetical protein